MLTQGSLTNSISDLILTPTGNIFAFKSLKLININSSTEIIEIYSKTNSTTLKLDHFQLDPNASIEMSTFYPLEYNAGEGIQASTTTNLGVNFFLMGALFNTP